MISISCGNPVVCGEGTTEKDGACIPTVDTSVESDTDTDADSDTDSDTDTDTDADSDTDTDTDTDTGILDTGPFDADGDGFFAHVDCDDNDSARYPGATEHCNGVDDNCDGLFDTGPLVTVDGTQSFITVQAAVSAAQAGDEVVVCPGNYYEVVQVGLPISIVSLSGPQSTLIGGFGFFGFPTIDATFLGAQTLDITGLTISGGETGGIVMAPASTLNLTDMLVTYNDGTGIVGADINMTDTEVSDNQANGDGGGLWLMDGTVTCVNSLITRNAADLLNMGGGAIVDGDVVMAGCDIRDNAADDGGGIAVIGGGTLDLTGSVVASNDGNDGAGIWLDGPLLIGGDIVANDGRGGSGVFSVWQDAIISGVLIRQNIASLGGGGVYFSAGGTLENSEVVDNLINSGNGGGVLVEDNALANIDNTIIERNTATDGGGIEVCRNATANVNGGTIRDNDADYDGGGVYIDNGGGMTLTAVDIGNNDPEDVGFSNGAQDFGGITNAICDDTYCY